MKLLLLGSGSYKSSLTFYRLVALGQQLARLGWKTTMIVPSADKYNNYRPEKKAHIDGIDLQQPWQLTTHHDIINLIPYLFSASWKILRARPQIIYLYKPTPITIIGLLPKLLFKTPVVADLDDLGSEVMRLEGQSLLQVRLVAWCEQLALGHATAVVVTSSYLEQIIKEKYPHKPILVLSNGVDPTDYQALPKTAPRHSLYYFGALKRLSLIEPFLRALPEVCVAVPDTHINILGDGGDRGAAEKLVESLGMAEHVTFCGYVDKEDLSKYVQFADIALCTQPDIPTVRAASNLKVFQYMAFATVTVVSDVGDLSSYVNGAGKDTKAGLVVPADDTQHLSETLIYLLTHDTLRAEMANTARKRATTVYAWPVLAGRLQSFLLNFTRSNQPAKQTRGKHA